MQAIFEEPRNSFIAPERGMSRDSPDLDPRPDPINGGDYSMKATQLLHNLGQSLWLDNRTRDCVCQFTYQKTAESLPKKILIL